ncbi:MAG TPA: 4-hydroxybenzoate octaprenyltransferase [Gammaproteobacteria bacterium]|nr:4-hydroxybenzoate octaprenyltransferase [Gammaproteobacteria bacterium]
MAARSLSLGRKGWLYLRLMRLNSPIGIWLLLWPTLWALWIASEGRPTPSVFAVFVIGTVLLRSAGCVINDFADRKIDPEVRRTANRPIASGEVAALEALILFVGLMLVAFGLVTMLDPLTVQLAVFGAVLTIVYPFMKRFIVAPQLVLGLAFAWGVPMAYAAETGAYPPSTGWLLFLCALIWVVIYDTEYAMSDRDDDLKLGIHSTAIWFGEMDVAIVAGLQLVLLGGLLLVGRSAGFGLWFLIGIAGAAAFGLRQLWLIRRRDPEKCLRAFWNNAWFGGAIFAGIVLDYIFAS